MSEHLKPTLYRFPWQILLQPVRLRAALAASHWDLGLDPPLWRLVSRGRDGLPFVVLLLGWMPAVVLVLIGALLLTPLPVHAEAAVWGVVLGIFVGIVFGVTSGTAVGLLAGVVWGAVGGAVGSVVFGAVFGAAFGLFGGLAVDARRGLLIALTGSAATGIVWGTVMAAPGGVFAEGLGAALVFAVLYFATFLRLPIYAVEVVLMAVIGVLAKSGVVSCVTLSKLLPFRGDDLVRFPLPFLVGFLIRLGGEDPQLAKDLIRQAEESLAQKDVIRRVLYELQAREIEDAGRRGRYRETVELDFVFGAESDLFLPFQKAAKMIRAAKGDRDTLHHAAEILRVAQIAFAGSSGPRERRLLGTIDVWLEVVDREIAALPQRIPIPFVAGPVLKPTERDLFRGRTDLAGLVRDDLAGNRRGTIVLFGQRRMGKSSFINMLPNLLGEAAEVVSVNFQGLSESDEAPHNRIAEVVADVLPDLPPPPKSDAWRDVLDWLREADRFLHDDEKRLLVTVDEVEGLEWGIREGWANPDFLDLMRAAGDNLERIRFLLATAHSLQSLGPHWVDRLINVLPRRLRPLEPAETEDLIRRPVPGFPDIYPPGGVERIAETTNGHPFLVQLVCDVLCRHLNEKRRLMATSDDIETAIDRALGEALVLGDIWRQRTKEEQRVLHCLAAGEDVDRDQRRVVQTLKEEGYVIERDDRLAVAIPMFADWIVGNIGLPEHTSFPEGTESL